MTTYTVALIIKETKERALSAELLNNIVTVSDSSLLNTVCRVLIHCILPLVTLWLAGLAIMFCCCCFLFLSLCDLLSPPNLAGRFARRHDTLWPVRL